MKNNQTQMRSELSLRRFYQAIKNMLARLNHWWAQSAIRAYEIDYQVRERNEEQLIKCDHFIHKI